MFSGFASAQYATAYLHTPSDAAAHQLAQRYSRAPYPRPNLATFHSGSSVTTTLPPSVSTATPLQQHSHPSGQPPAPSDITYGQATADSPSVLTTQSHVTSLAQTTAASIKSQVDMQVARIMAEQQSALASFSTHKNSIKFPSFSGKASDYLAWSHELDMILSLPEWNQIKDAAKITPLNAVLSHKLYVQLIQCLASSTIRPMWLEKQHLLGKGIELLAALSAKHKPSTPQHLVLLHGLWTRLSQLTSKTIEAFAFRLTRLINRLSKAGQSYCETFQIITFLNGLDSRFAPFQTEFTTGSQTLTNIPLSQIVLDAQAYEMKLPSTGLGRAADAQSPGISEPWMGASPLTEEQVTTLVSTFTCGICRSNKHPFKWCPCLKKLYFIDTHV